MSVLAQSLFASYAVSGGGGGVFPVVESTNSTGYSGTTSHAMNMPTGIQTGDLLVAFIVMDGAPTLTFPSGWSLVQTVNNPVTTTTGYIYVKTAVGADTLTVTSDVSEASACTVYRISGASNCEATQLYNSTSVTDWQFPSISPSAGNRKYLAIANIAISTVASTSDTPSGFTDLITITGGGTGSNASARVYTWRSNIEDSTISPSTVVGSSSRQIASMTAAVW